MLVINKPEVFERGNDAILQASFVCGTEQETLWFSTPRENKSYLCHERGDAFLVGLLLYAMKRGEDITVMVPVSERLYYTLTTYYIKVMAEMFPELKKIKIFCETDAGLLDNAGAVGTGFSGGVDSFCTVVEHMAQDCPPDYRLTHLAFFNVGASGDNGGEDARKRFLERISLVKPCTDEYGLPLVTVDSNLSDIVQMNYLHTHTWRSSAAVLALQKLFRVFYYSSGYPVKQFEADPLSSGHYDLFSLNMLSTHDVEFFSAGSMYSRVEKTEIISSEPLSYKYLNVCVAEESNCSQCPKCLRTMITLDILGKLDRYDRVFNLDTYRRLKSRWVAGLIVERGVDPFKKEIHAAMHQYHFRMPLSAYAWIPLLWSYDTGYRLAAYLYITFLKPKKNRPSNL